MDISYLTGNQKFNYRVCAVMAQQGRILAMRDERSPYYYLPGGRVKLGEKAEQALLREVKEELGAAARIVRPLWLNQAFFTEDVDQIAYHELCLYFLVDLSGSDILQRGERFTLLEGAYRHEFAWLPFENLEKEYFYPLFLKKEIFHLPGHLTLRVEDERPGKENEMHLRLVRLTPAYKEQLVDMLEEWKKDIDEHQGNRSPSSIFRNDWRDFDHYLENLEVKQRTPEGRVPDSVLFCLDTDRNIFVGAVNIRHELNDDLLQTGGHIGDGIRPSERRKGYATQMIALALQECRRLGIGRVLMTCDKNNIGSVKSIVRNGGVLENEVPEDGVTMQRYWIDLEKG